MTAVLYVPNVFPPSGKIPGVLFLSGHTVDAFRNSDYQVRMIVEGGDIPMVDASGLSWLGTTTL